jgi:pilus assembly protein Flp/PilA
MSDLIKYFRRDERGATATEYAILIVFVALAVAFGAQTLGSSINNLFSQIGTQLSTINPLLPKLPGP